MPTLLDLRLGNNLDVLPTLDAGSVDAIVTDPPYGLGFMGKEWDRGVPAVPFWEAMLRVLKPGGHLLAFGGSRTFHRIACNIEDAGFEIRDTIMWLYGSGFPKSLDVSKAIDKAGRRDYVAAALRLGMKVPGRNVDDWTKESHSPGDRWWAKFKECLSEHEWSSLEREVVGCGRSGSASVAYVRPVSAEFDVTVAATDAARQWEGWGTALKPAFEPVVVARKPFVGTVAGNVLEYGTGGLNIDGCRLAALTAKEVQRSGKSTNGSIYGDLTPTDWKSEGKPHPGRWPANVVLDEQAAEALDEQTGELKTNAGTYRNDTPPGGMWGISGAKGRVASTGDQGGASRFFYVAKASKKDRNLGLPDGVTNSHPTVKPHDLMRWLVRLVTPPGGVVLDPFMGSGSTGRAAVAEGFDFIGIERDADYLEIARQRIEAQEIDGVQTLDGVA